MSHRTELGQWERACWMAWELVATQLRVVAGASGALVIGLDYAAARSVLETYGLWVRPVVDGLRIIEAAAVAELNAKDN